MIYADYNGSSPLVPPVKEYLKKRIESDLFANPNAIHTMGQKIYQGIEKCREIIAGVVGCYPDQIIFNSGASEGISHVLHSILEYTSADKKIIITSRIEHAVIPKALKFYQERRGFTVKYLEVDSQGVVKIESLKKLIEENKNKIALVTVMAANNETGVIQAYKEIQKLCDAHAITYFSDTTQFIGKAEFNFKRILGGVLVVVTTPVELVVLNLCSFGSKKNSSFCALLASLFSRPHFVVPGSFKSSNSAF